jgi:hypothetical protein
MIEILVSIAALPTINFDLTIMLSEFPALLVIKVKGRNCTLFHNHEVHRCNRRSFPHYAVL